MLTLNDGRTELWQWDTGRKLTVDADCTQVHFSNKVFGRSIDVDVVDGVAIIPDILLQVDKELMAWAFVGTAENGYTKISKVFKVNKRNKPSDYVFTPTDQATLGEILNRIEDLEKRPSGDVSKEDIQDAVNDYLDKNPVSVVEKDPTVPDWAKHTSKPKYTAKEVGAVATVNGTSPDGNGNVQIKVPDSVEGAVLYTEQTLTEEQKAQARANIGAVSKEEVEQLINPEDTPGALSAKQINALDALFKATSYIKDASAEYAAFCDAFGLTEPDVPDVVIPSVKQGSVSFENGKMGLNGAMASRATLIPIGQYLKNGASYRFSLGDAASTYVYGIQVFVADSPALEFPHSYETVIYDGVSERLVDIGWTSVPFGYSVTKDNCILAVNFRKNDYADMSDSDYAVLFESFKIEEILPTDDDIAQSVKMGAITYQNSSIVLQPNYSKRATIVPLGRYLTKGKTYRFSLGSVADTYRYSVMIYTAQAEGLIFPYVAGKNSIYPALTKRIVNSGWLETDYTYTPDTDNCVVTVHFKGNPEVTLNDSNYDEIFENFVIEEIS